MSRIPGTFLRDYNNEVTIQAPIDARTLVETYEALTTSSNWVDKNGFSIAFNGLVVSVADRVDTSKNGIYYLFDPAADPAAWIDPDVTKAENWHKIAEGTDINEILSRLGAVAENTSLVEMISDALQAAKDYADTKDSSADLEEVRADLATLKTTAQSTSSEVANLVNKVSSLETQTTENTNNIATLINSVNNINYDIAILIGEDRDAETGKANKSIRAIAADEINALINAADPDGGKAIENIANLVSYVDENAGEIADLVAATNANRDKLAGIETTVVEAIAKAKEEAIAAANTTVKVATTETLGGIKSATGENKVNVDENGIASVSSVNVNTLTQTPGETLVLNGGAATA
jgi:uncharacterized coiled-coil DUF342 family protein